MEPEAYRGLTFALVFFVCEFYSSRMACNAGIIGDSVGLELLPVVSASLLDLQRRDPRGFQWLPLLACWLTEPSKKDMNISDVQAQNTEKETQAEQGDPFQELYRTLAINAVPSHGGKPVPFPSSFVSFSSQIEGLQTNQAILISLFWYDNRAT